jgi:hypothetical protein
MGLGGGTYEYVSCVQFVLNYRCEIEFTLNYRFEIEFVLNYRFEIEDIRFGHPKIHPTSKFVLVISDFKSDHPEIYTL